MAMAKKYVHLNQEERVLIAQKHGEGEGLPEIARLLGRSKGTTHGSSIGTPPPNTDAILPVRLNN
jgi:hypothetical protein